MKHLSLKIKLTILYTILMTAVVCGALSVLLSLGNYEILSSVQRQLEEQVAEARGDIQYKNGALKFDSDILELKYGVYLSVYASDGTLLYGKIPYDFDNSARFEHGNIRKIQGENGIWFYLLDMIYQIPEYGVVDIRGVVSITEAETEFVATIRLALVLLPLLIVLMALLAYYMTGRTLKPVGQMIETVQSMEKNGDFSKRIALGSGKDEIYRLAQTFDALLEKVENSIQREQQFTSDVAHELRTPVSTMSLQCEDLLENSSLDAEAREGVAVLHRKVQHISQMVSQLLILSRVDQGRAKVEKEVLNLSELTELAVEEIRVQAEGKNISVHTQIQSDIWFCGDETLLIRLWMNLLKNAVCYGRNGGNLWVSLRMWGDDIQAEVRDDGIGIDEKDLPYIWERFYQADKARSDTESSGIGLSMAKWIVGEHAGMIQVKSRIGEGSSFYFSFPAKEEVVQFDR